MGGGGGGLVCDSRWKKSVLLLPEPWLIDLAHQIRNAAVAIADVMSKGASATALASFPAQRMPLMRTRNGMMLAYDGALGPLYTEGEDPVVEYKWSGVHSKGYDPEFQVCRPTPSTPPREI